jgi:hypothetical protein
VVFPLILAFILVWRLLLVFSVSIVLFRQRELKVKISMNSIRKNKAKEEKTEKSIINKENMVNTVYRDKLRTH